MYAMYLTQGVYQPGHPKKVRELGFCETMLKVRAFSIRNSAKIIIVPMAIYIPRDVSRPVVCLKIRYA